MQTPHTFKEGELVLIINRHRNPKNIPILGICKRQNKEHKITLSESLSLQPPLSIGGKMKAGVVRANKSYDIEMNPEVITGKDEIIEYLASQPELSNHIYWVKRLEKPYKFPRLHPIAYIDLFS